MHQLPLHGSVLINKTFHFAYYMTTAGMCDFYFSHYSSEPVKLILMIFVYKKAMLSQGNRAMPL